MDNEIWKDIPGYEGLYQVSNLGRIKVLRINIVKKSFIEGSGYSFTRITKNKKGKNFKIHRAVMLAFVGEDEVRKFVNHKDGNKQNNKLENLEWVTRSENDKHKYRVLGYKTPFQIKNPFPKRKIIQYSLEGIFIKEWLGIRVAAKELSISKNGIIACCQGTQKTSCGFIWKYSV